MSVLDGEDGEDEEDEEDDEDHSGDNVVTIGHSQLLSCGQVSFASWVDNICRHYESGHTKVTHGYHQSLYVEAASPKAINISVPPSHRSIIQQITLVPPEEVTSLYSLCEVFASAFWVWDIQE